MKKLSVLIFAAMIQGCSGQADSPTNGSSGGGMGGAGGSAGGSGGGNGTGGGSMPQTVSVVVSPRTALVASGMTVTFTAAVTGSADTAVTWTIQETGGGSITPAGVYTSPAAAGTYHVIATSHADATKKDQATVQAGPTPPADWVNVTGNLAGMNSECGNMGAVFPDPHSDTLITGVAQQGLWTSKVDGVWVAAGTTGAKITNRISSVVFDPTRAGVFWESGIYNGGGVYKTSDSGASFAQEGTIGHCDSVSVDFTDPDRKTQLAGAHEQARKLYLSVNSGSSWTDIGMALPAGSGFCTNTLVLNATTFLAGCGGWYGGTPGIYRSSNTGASWTLVSDKGVAGQPLLASNGTIYWAGHQGGGMYKSVDQGLTWVAIGDASKSIAIAPVELPDGRIVAAGPKTLMVTADKGTSWQAIGTNLPFTPHGLSYSASRKAFYLTHFTCSNPVPADGVMRFGFQ
jgi:hypothetical protein